MKTFRVFLYCLLLFLSGSLQLYAVAFSSGNFRYVTTGATHTEGGVTYNCVELTGFTPSAASDQKYVDINSKTVTYSGVTYWISRIADSAFKSNKNIKSVYLTLSGLTEIGEYAFYQCTNLERVYPNGYIKTIGSYAFAGCFSLQFFDFGQELETMGSYTFSGCWTMEYVRLTSTCKLKGINPYTFNGCILFKGFKKFVNGAWVYCALPSNFTTISDHAFCYCASLQDGIIDSNSAIQTIGSYAFNTTGLTTVFIPKTISMIFDNAFAGYGLKSVRFADDAKPKISEKAFSGCLGLEAVSLPKGTVSIGDKAFYNCPKLRIVSVQSTDDPLTISKETFSTGTTKNNVVQNEATLVLPNSNKLDKYKAAEGWKYFKTQNTGSYLECAP